MILELPGQRSHDPLAGLCTQEKSLLPLGQPPAALPSTVQSVVKREASVIGQPLKRMEDPKFITGSGRYTGDIVLPRMLHAAFVRSPHGHARVKRIETSKAAAMPGVTVILTGSDLAGEVDMMPTVEGEEGATATKRSVLAQQEANFAGEPVALVVATDPYTAEDAAEAVEVDYEPLPVVVDPVKALAKGSPKVHDYLPDNLLFHSTISVGNVKKAFRGADHVIEAELQFPRLSAVPMEPRNAVASYEQASGFLTVWISTQTPHEARDDLASVLRLPENKVRVIAPDMGGGFGQKGAVFPEHYAVCFASMKLDRPVKWEESRKDNLSASSHGRGQTQYVKAAVRRDGKILGLDLKVICDGGAYNDWAASMPNTTIMMAPGVYDITAYHAEALTACTNKPPIGAYRGAGRPEAIYLVERTIDVIARRLKLDPVKVRLMNLVPRGKFPYKSAGGFTYDSGNYAFNLNKALELSKYDDLKAFQRRARADGRLIGVGLAMYVEVSGFGRNYPQTAAVSVSKQGRVTVSIGTMPHGQGHWTPFAQIASEVLGIDVNDVAIQHGDTATLPWSTITAGSRSAVVGGTAVFVSCTKIRDKMAKIAAKMLGSKTEKLKFKDGKIASPTGKSVPFSAVASAAYVPSRLPPGLEPTLYEYTAWAPPNNVFPFGTHVVMTEVDRDTGLVRILKYVAVDDVGKVLNPLIVEGQVQGGVLQGVSQALLEQVVYDENGQLLTATLSDYLIPSTETAPLVECYRTETPSPLNPLGVKGVGEAGTVAATPAVASAVEDALSAYGAVLDRLPLTPEYVRSFMSEGS
jgi:aerobic carbon-monoxide dehydrogenase large subunit